MQTRGHQYKLCKPKATKLVRSQCFSQRVVNDWNSLVEDVVNAQTVNEFKEKLDTFWESQQYKTPFD